MVLFESSDGGAHYTCRSDCTDANRSSCVGSQCAGLPHFGGIGEQYARFTDIGGASSSDLMATFTVRCNQLAHGGVVHPGKAKEGHCNGTLDGMGLGLRAVISSDNGKTWNFDRDRLVISDKTRQDQWSGGGYGNTVEVLEGGVRSLVSVYSYRTGPGPAGDTRVEAVRWRLP